MLVGEQPGDVEDREGQPFVGPAGRLLDRAIAELGWQRERLYLTNAVKHFKFELRGKRRIHKTPAQREAAACHHWLDDEIDAVGAAAIVALGAIIEPVFIENATPLRFTRHEGRWTISPLGLNGSHLGASGV